VFQQNLDGVCQASDRTKTFTLLQTVARKLQVLFLIAQPLPTIIYHGHPSTGIPVYGGYGYGFKRSP